VKSLEWQYARQRIYLANNKNSLLLQKHPTASRQRGAALLVALVMIFMMTVLGLTAMRESSLEKRMTTNSVHKSSTFRMTLPSPSNVEMSLTGTIEYTGIGPPIGFSWGKTGGGGFQALRYRIEGESKIVNVQSSSKVRQGTYRTVPALN